MSAKNRRILVMTAMPKEHKAVTASIFRAGLEEGVDVCATGIGKVNAAIMTTASILRRSRDNFCDNPDCVISVGCSGALVAGLDPGTVVVGSSAGYWDVDCGSACYPGQIQGMPPVFPTDPSLSVDVVDCLSEASVESLCGDMVSGDRFLTAEGDIDRVREKFPHAFTIDMETAAVAHVCSRFGIPFAAVRVVSDSPGRALDRVMLTRAELYHQFWEDEQCAVERFGFVPAVVQGARRFALRVGDGGPHA